MAWLGKVSLGGFPDLAGAVNKLSESVKNIEKNFDSALGLEEKPESGEASETWRPSLDGKALFDPVMAFMGHKGEENSVQRLEEVESLQSSEKIEFLQSSEIVEALSSEKVESVQLPPSAEDSNTASTEGLSLRSEQSFSAGDEGGHIISRDGDAAESMSQVPENHGEVKQILQSAEGENVSSVVDIQETSNSVQSSQDEDAAKLETYDDSQSKEYKTITVNVVEPVANHFDSAPDESQHSIKSIDSHDEQRINVEQSLDSASSRPVDALNGKQANEPEHSTSSSIDIVNTESVSEPLIDSSQNIVGSEQASDTSSDSAFHENELSIKPVEMDTRTIDPENDNRGQHLNSKLSSSDSKDTSVELEKMKREMKMMEAALQGAARQAQAKADEIAKFMNENEQLKLTIDELKRKSVDAETDALREEYHQRVASLERKVYALTKERDTLRREQSRKSDAAALLKEKDEIINQVMAEGEELSKKQAAQEATIRKLRALIRELEEEKQRLNSKLQVEETKVESIKRDKAATEKLLQETIEKSQAELASQKEYYTNALNAAKEAEALAEARANNEARTELESRLKEAGERETTLVLALEELRQTLSRTEQQAVFREDMLRRDVDELNKRYQDSERRCEELITQVPESTRPLLRQIEAMQETTARRAEAWAGVERALNSRLQEAEAKAAAAEERERSMNERLSQTLSRMAVLEAQVSCLRAEQTQLTRSLEKERQRASENRQEYLAAMEAAATHEGRAKQLEDEIKELRSKHKQELQLEITRKELLEQELERERAVRLELEKSSSNKASLSDHTANAKLTSSYVNNGDISMRKRSSAGSLSSMDESYYLHASLDSSNAATSERITAGETFFSTNPYFMKNMTPSTFEAALRQKDGEISSYMSRLGSLESIRDSLAEELVKMTEQCEKLRAEAVMLPSVRAELEALRRRHTAALELMGERDEELEELRADIVDLKEMYREQVDLLVNKIQRMSSSIGNS